MAKRATPKQVPAFIPGDVKQAILEGSGKAPSVGDLVQHFFDLVGGERAVAKLLLDEYKSPTCTAYTRSKIMEVILRSLMFSNAKDQRADDLAGMNEADLELELTGILKRAGSGEGEPKTGTAD